MTRSGKKRFVRNDSREAKEKTHNSLHMRLLPSGRLRVRPLHEVQRERRMLEEMEARNAPWLRGDRSC